MHWFPDSKYGASGCAVYHGGMSSSTGQAPGVQHEPTQETGTGDPPNRPWTRAQCEAAEHVASRLSEDVPQGVFVAVGLAGPPGSGKSSLARMVASRLEESGSPTVVLSLDDYYLGKSARRELSATHPLFAQRGVPGTHDWRGLISDLDHLAKGRLQNLRLRKFDKLADDVADPRTFRQVTERPRVCLLEGWLVGAPEQKTDALTRATNRMEDLHDADRAWRTRVNAHLAEYHQDLESRLARRWYLSAPDWDAVVQWRWQQEQQRAAQVDRHLKSRQDVEQFLQQFQRIVVHMQNTASQWADQIVTIDTHHILSFD